ncbi:MAG: PKD domain-containing protein [Chitinophagaceae bacterium]|nr:PKD domain-containing protein [Chitinophagaceae bacterium]
MKKLITLLFAVLTVFSFSAYAQPGTICDAGFNFTVNGNTSTVQFTPTTINTSALLQHQWIFGDGTAGSNFLAPSHEYAAPGAYYVTHIVTYRSPNDSSLVQCYDSVGRLLTIAGLPACNIHSNFSFIRDSIQTNKVYFSNLSTGTDPNTQVKWYFGDGTFSYDNNPTHIYQTSGVFTVCLAVRRDSLCADDTCKMVQVQVPVNTCNLQAYFSSHVDSSNHLLVHFFNQSVPMASTDSVRWTFGDGSSSTDLNPSHTYNQGGIYTVCLVIKRNVPGTVPCMREYCQAITLLVPPPACNIHSNFSFIRDSIQTNKVYFSNLSTGTDPNTQVKWYFGDGTFSYDNNPTHIYQTSGVFTVCLAVKRDSLCADDTCKMVQVQVPVNTCNLQAYFSSHVDSYNHLLVHFFNQSVPMASTDSVRWTFGDGSSSTDLNPSHTYNQGGIYTVCLVIKRNVPGTVPCVREYCQTITVQPSTACNLVAGFVFYRDTIPGTTLSTYRFENTSTPLNNIDSSFWDFGDGTPVLINPNNLVTHTYASPGVYIVCLRVKKVLAGSTLVICERQTCQTIVITIPTACNLHANFNWLRDSSNNRKLYFNNLTNAQPANAVATWTFGDGTSINSWNAYHIYNTTGQFTVCLKVTVNGANCFSDTCQVVTVTQTQPDSCNLIVGFASHADSINRRKVYFSNTTPVNSSAATAHWSFGDGTVGIGWDAEHIYAQAGLYVVCLTVTTANNCTRVTCDSVLVQGGIVPPPLNCDSIQLGYVYRRDAYMSNKLFFFATSNRPILQQQWAFTNLSNNTTVTVNQNDPVHVFGDTGYYRVCLRATYWGGCVKEYCHVVRINRTNVPSQCILHSYPNPAHSQVSVHVQLAQPGLITASVFSSQSILLMQHTQQGIAGNNLVTLNIQNLAPGFYTVRIMYGGRVCYTRFQKI